MENKTGKYLKYAIGEIVLVVIGILIALEVNNWNENKKLDIEKTKLVKGLISDFEITKKRLIISLDKAKNVHEKSVSFLSMSEEDIQNISIDSLVDLAGFFIDRITFEPMLATYNRTLSSGAVNLFENDSLFKLFPDFFLEYDSFKIHDNIGGELVYKESTWEVRKALGSMNVFYRNNRYPKSFELSETQYRNFLLQKNIYAAMENMAWIYRNSLENLESMDKTTNKILIELRKSLAQK